MSYLPWKTLKEYKIGDLENLDLAKQNQSKGGVT